MWLGGGLWVEGLRRGRGGDDLPDPAPVIRPTPGSSAMIERGTVVLWRVC